ncbi:hypothetical protein JHK87_007762 [Glycine soja]|nr:hypothetical protein JHK87_007762 [Glycine soja]
MLLSLESQGCPHVFVLTALTIICYVYFLEGYVGDTLNVYTSLNKNLNIVFERPFSEEFMKFCLERFEVGIWSSAME